ncbi:MAG: glycosyltransferase [Candidatus Krumholzibacteria bacterium]|nr:glycosyltransferase [Candidatus Krumholzibacteria bacterium]
MNGTGSRTRVIILASTLVTGGAEAIVQAIALGMPGRGIDPTLVCLRAPGEIGERLAGAGIPVRAGLRGRGWGGGALMRLVALLRVRRDAVLLCLDHHDSIALGVAAARIAGLPGRILAVHSTGLWGRSGSFSRSDRLSLGGFSRVVAVADSHRDYLVRKEGIRGDRIVVIHNGVDIKRFRPPSAEERQRARWDLRLETDSYVAVIVAALRPEKNHEMLLRAAARLRREDPRFVLLIAGEGKQAGDLRELAGVLGLGDAVRFLGRRTDIPAVLAAADVSVLCSHPVVETFPLSLLESMACALPVVATSVGSIPEMIEHGREGILIPAGDEDALTAAVAGLGGEPRRRGELGARARMRVEERYSEDLMIDSYARLLGGLDPSKGDSSGIAC